MKNLLHVVTVMCLSFFLMAVPIYGWANTTCIDSNTLQINTTSETYINDNWVNHSRVEYEHCSLGCSTIDGPRCRTVVEGAIPIEVFLPLQLLAFLFLIMTFRLEEYDYRDVIWPLLSMMMFFITGFMSISVYSPSIGHIFSSMYLLYFNFFMGFFMVLFTLIFTLQAFRYAEGQRRE